MNIPSNEAVLNHPLSAKGRFSRLSYLAWTFLSGIIFNGVYAALAVGIFIFFGATTGLDADPDFNSSTTLLIIFGSILFIFSIIYMFYTVIFTIRRLHDCDKSGWLAILLLLPIINLFFLLYIFMAKGSEGINRYGAPRPTKDWERILGIIYLVLIPIMLVFVVGVLAAIAIPAYQDYVERAQYHSEQMYQNELMQHSE